MNITEIFISGELPNSHGLSALSGERSLNANEYHSVNEAFSDIKSALSQIQSPTMKGLTTLAFPDVRVTLYNASGSALAQDRTLYAPDGRPYGNHPGFAAPFNELTHVHIGFDLAAGWDFTQSVPRAADGTFLAVTLYHEVLHSSFKIDSMSKIKFLQVLNQNPNIISDFISKTGTNQATTTQNLVLAIEHDIIYSMEEEFSKLLEQSNPQKYAGASSASSLDNKGVYDELQFTYGILALSDADVNILSAQYNLDHYDGWDDIDSSNLTAMAAETASASAKIKTYFDPPNISAQLISELVAESVADQSGITVSDISRDTVLNEVSNFSSKENREKLAENIKRKFETHPKGAPIPNKISAAEILASPTVADIVDTIKLKFNVEDPQ